MQAPAELVTIKKDLKEGEAPGAANGIGAEPLVEYFTIRCVLPGLAVHQAELEEIEDAEAVASTEGEETFALRDVLKEMGLE